MPPLRERREDIALLADAALTKLSREWQLDKPALSAEAQQLLAQYDFPGNVRELENTLERAYTLCEGATISADDLQLSAASRGRASSLYSSASDEQAFGSLDDYLQGIEKEAIAKALEKTRWNKTAAAQLLGISFRQLRHRLKKLDLDND